LNKTRGLSHIVLAFFLVLNLLTPNVHGVTVLSDLSDDFTESYNYIFIGTIVHKTVEANQTLYLLNVTENLKQPINTTQITITTMGGFEIAVSPSVTFYTGLEYLVFFDEMDEENKVTGFDYYASLLSQITDERLQTIRNEADKSRAIELAVPMFHSQLPRISNPLYNVSNVNVTNVMKYLWERPEGSGNFSDVWRVEIRCEGFEEDGDHVWRAIMFHVVLDTDEIMVGPIVGDKIEDTQVEDNQIVEEAERNDWGQTPKELGIAILLIIIVLLFLIQKARN
jgi:hypothetical protein